MRGHAFEAFSFPAGGLPALLKQQSARFSLEADLAVGTERYRYRVEPSIELRSGHLSVADEYLALLERTGSPKGTPAIERVDSKLRLRRKGKPAHPREEPVGMNHAILSDRSFAGEEYRWLEIVRRELGEWCTHYLDPALAMRAPRSPADVFDIGSYGEDIAPFLYKLRAEEPGRFRAVSHATAIAPFDATGPWFKDSEIAAALTSQAEDGLFENLMMRGLIDE